MADLTIPEPMSRQTSNTSQSSPKPSGHATFEPLVCIVGFHHARGPEIETWIGCPPDHDPAAQNDWSLLPFQALSDGAHATTEDFSYFTLRRAAVTSAPNDADAPQEQATSLFGISCTRQLAAEELKNRPKDVTRSTVQKAVVVVVDAVGVRYCGWVREKLSVVTRAWFAQRDFTDMEIIERFQESLSRSFKDMEHEKDNYFGLSLRELIHQFKWQTLVLLKCCLLQPKMLFFGSQCEKLCLIQFGLISLIPGLLRQLQDCADPAFNSLEENHSMPTSLRTSDRSSLLAYMGLPLHLFGKGSLFGPYTPLQQLDMLADHGTKSYIVGSTNSLLLQQKDRYSDILINLDENTINISSPSLRTALALSTADRRWMDYLTGVVQETWDDSNPSRPKTLGYQGSEEFIRLQFEEYLLGLLSSVKYNLYVSSHRDSPKPVLLDTVEGDPAAEYNTDFITAWQRTENFRIWNKYTDSHLFDIVDPKHPMAGGLTIEDVQRRVAAQISELHLDERYHASREALGRHLATGQKKVSSAFNSLWADIEAMREAQRLKAAAAASQASSPTTTGPTASTEKDTRLSTASTLFEQPSTTSPTSPTTGGRDQHWTPKFGYPKAPDLSHAQANLHAASSKAGAYLSSWGAWASEKRKAGWGKGGAGTGSAGGTPVSSPPAVAGEFGKERGVWEGEARGKEVQKEDGDGGKRAVGGEEKASTGEWRDAR